MEVTQTTRLHNVKLGQAREKSGGIRNLFP